MDGVCLKKYTDLKTSFISANLNYSSGTQLYIKMYATWQNSAPTNVPYSIAVNTTADVAWEQENNDVMATAVVLSSDVAKTGSLIYANDVDYYTYTVDKTGYFTLDFSRLDPTLDPGWGWKIAIYDENGNSLSSYTFKTNSSTQKLNFKRGTKLYIKICADWNNSAPVDQYYTINMKTEAKSDWEVETLQDKNATWSNRIKDAAKLTSKKRYGSLWTNTDNDIYKLSVSSTGKVTLKFNPNNIENNLGWGYTLELFDKNGESVKKFDNIKSNTNNVFYAKKGTYYVVVYASWDSSAPPSTDTYTISATSKKASTPFMKNKKISFTTQTSTLKWSKVSDVDGYEIQLCKNTKFKKSSTIVLTTSEKSMRLYSSNAPIGKYYVKVRAYRETITGEKIYGSFTKVKKINKKYY